ncbi:peptidylprolyl isomerase SurA [Alteromonadaceae bacterium M269]|nr:peptidylprolyl isomerase SurA [Alteromonadaceae bacterium M269]
MKLKALLVLGCLFTASYSIAQQQVLDKVAVIVNEGVVLESEIQTLLRNVKANAQQTGQALPSDRALRVQATERLITENLQMQAAERIGIQISDPQLEQTIENIARQQGLTLLQLRGELNASGVSYDSYRETVRKELITGEVRRASVRRRVIITPQEIENLVKLIEAQGEEQTEFRLGHILIEVVPDATPEDVDAARETADKVLELLNSGSDFAKIAIASSGGSEALEGGDMGWMNINSMPTLFADAVQNLGKDDLVGPIRSGAGFHILKVTDIRGQETVEVEEVNSRHILIQPSVILSNEKAQKMLVDFREKLINGEADFAELAREHSADPGSALKGGELGYADPNIYVPAFKDALAALEADEYSQPFRSQHGWHLVQLIDRRMGDVTEQVKQEKAYQLLFQRKFAEETDNWLREIRDTAFVELIEESAI